MMSDRQPVGAGEHDEVHKWNMARPHRQVIRVRSTRDVGEHDDIGQADGWSR